MEYSTVKASMLHAASSILAPTIGDLLASILIPAVVDGASRCKPIEPLNYVGKKIK